MRVVTGSFVNEETFCSKGVLFLGKRAFIIRWLANAIVLFMIPYLMGPAVRITGFVPALLAAFILGIVNALIRPVLIILSLPIQLLTLGLFTLIINGFMLWIVSRVVQGFYISGFWAAVLASILLSIGSSIISWVVQDL
ncbi:MAG TPA: phage holin family protein [Firmicutes bacterium]|jgi:putative membrane protein|nr:phage holin family protein [Bacillota bacterium]